MTDTHVENIQLITYRLLSDSDQPYLGFCCCLFFKILCQITQKEGWKNSLKKNMKLLPISILSRSVIQIGFSCWSIHQIEYSFQDFLSAMTGTEWSFHTQLSLLFNFSLFLPLVTLAASSQLNFSWYVQIHSCLQFQCAQRLYFTELLH